MCGVLFENLCQQKEVRIQKPKAVKEPRGMTEGGCRWKGEARGLREEWCEMRLAKQVEARSIEAL